MQVTRQMVQERQEKVDAALERFNETTSADVADELSMIDSETVGQWAGTGRHREGLERTARKIGPDYICALDDGSILAWGAEGLLGRDVVIIDEPTDA